METVKDMKQETIENLQDLVSINLDSSKGFKTAASHIEDPAMKNLFNQLSGQRSYFAEQLKGFVAKSGVKPEDSGSLQGKAHRWWMDLRSKLTDEDLKAMLSEAERGEDRIKELYEKVIVESTGNPVNDVLHTQYTQVKQAHDKIRDLRDLEKELS